MDEFNGLKSRIGALTKKDTGSLLVRDFTDEIYMNNKVPKEVFAEHFESQLFTNLLIVLNQERFLQFADGMGTLMARYYEQIDEVERKRVRDAARSKFLTIITQHN